MNVAEYASNILPSQLQALLNMVPNVPENQALYEALQSMVNAPQKLIRPFTYSAVYAVAGAANSLAAAAANVPANIQIGADADFLILNQTWFANTLNAAMTAASQPVPNISVIISDTASAQQMSDVAVPIGSIFGTGRQPYILPVPKLIAASAMMTTMVNNFDAAAGYNLWLNFNGLKIYKS